MVSERTQVLTAEKFPLEYMYCACVSVQMCTIPKTGDLVFAYLHSLSYFHFFMIYLK